MAQLPENVTTKISIITIIIIIIIKSRASYIHTISFQHDKWNGGGM